MAIAVARFQRIFKSAMDELHELQKTRKENEQRALEQLIPIALAHI